jgi:predicted ferric reductase
MIAQKVSNLMSWWASVTWITARAAGFTAFGLLTVAVALGLVLSLKLQSPRWPRLINNELHNYLTLLSTIFVGVHVLAVWLDPFTHFSLDELLIPFASHYRPLWMAFGIVALYLGIAIGISTLLRKRIGYALWRQLHTLTLVLYAFAVFHGVFVGTDGGSPWALLVYGSSLILVGILFWQRLDQPATPTRQPGPVARR